MLRPRVYGPRRPPDQGKLGVSFGFGTSGTTPSGMCWLIRMKAGREHRVPSSRWLALLEALPRMAGTDLVFPAPRGRAL